MSAPLIVGLILAIALACGIAQLFHAADVERRKRMSSSERRADDEINEQLEIW